MSGRRPKRVAELIRSELGNALRVSIEDSVLQKVSITNVEVTGDLRVARVFFMFDGEDSTAASVRLEAARGYLRHHVGAALKLRWVPELKFEPDDHAFRVDNLLKLIDEAGKQ